MWKFLPEVKVLAETKWLRLENLAFTDQRGRPRSWDRCVRCHSGSKPDEPDAVLILATTEKNEGEEHLILVKQFRPALGRYTVELPAGLIDPGESVESAGFRELREETGYAANEQPDGFTISPTICVSPGLARETCKLLHIKSKTLPGEATPEEDELIDVLLFPIKTLLEDLKSYHLKNPEVMIFEGVYMFALGLDMAKNHL